MRLFGGPYAGLAVMLEVPFSTASRKLHNLMVEYGHSGLVMRCGVLLVYRPGTEGSMKKRKVGYFGITPQPRKIGRLTAVTILLGSQRKTVTPRAFLQQDPQNFQSRYTLDFHFLSSCLSRKLLQLFLGMSAQYTYIVQGSARKKL